MIDEFYCNCNIDDLVGFYAPMTSDGNIVVDGVLASCYGSFDHDLAHISMMPIQCFPQTMEWIFGVDILSPDYVNFLQDIGQWVLPNNLMY